MNLRPTLAILAFAATVACADPRGGTGTGAQPGGRPVEYGELLAMPVAAADRRVAYGERPQQYGELRLPPAGVGGARLAVVVLLHGGCWLAQYDIAYMAPAAAALARAGYAVWTPEYRRVGDEGGGWTGTFDDVGRAVDHVRVLAAATPALDTTHVVVAGHSAGGQLALWAASRRAGEPLAGPAPLRVAGVVGLAAITDLAAYQALGGCGSAIEPLLGGTPATVPERYRLVSPIERVPLGAPVQLVQGDADPIVPRTHADGFVARARAAGDHVVVEQPQGAGHFDVVAPQARAWAATLAAVRALAGPGAGT